MTAAPPVTCQCPSRSPVLSAMEAHTSEGAADQASVAAFVTRWSGAACDDVPPLGSLPEQLHALTLGHRRPAGAPGAAAAPPSAAGQARSGQAPGVRRGFFDSKPAKQQAQQQVRRHDTRQSLACVNADTTTLSWLTASTTAELRGGCPPTGVTPSNCFGQADTRRAEGARQRSPPRACSCSRTHACLHTPQLPPDSQFVRRSALVGALQPSQDMMATILGSPELMEVRPRVGGAVDAVFLMKHASLSRRSTIRPSCPPSPRWPPTQPRASHCSSPTHHARAFRADPICAHPGLRSMPTTRR